MNYPGVTELVAAMGALMSAWNVDSVSVTRRLPDGHMLTLQLAGPILTIERDDGALITVPLGELLGE